MATAKEKAGMFEKLFDLSDDAKKKNKKHLVAKKLKRTIEQAADNVEDKKIAAEETLQTLSSDFENFDINAILKQKKIIKECDVLSSEVKDLYEEFFAEKMK